LLVENSYKNTRVIDSFYHLIFNRLYEIIGPKRILKDSLFKSRFKRINDDEVVVQRHGDIIPLQSKLSFYRNRFSIHDNSTQQQKN
jgi:hypothetical protein